MIFIMQQLCWFFIFDKWDNAALLSNIGKCLVEELSNLILLKHAQDLFTILAVTSAPGAYKIIQTDKIQIPHNTLSLPVFKSSIYHFLLRRYACKT